MSDPFSHIIEKYAWCADSLTNLKGLSALTNFFDSSEVIFFIEASSSEVDRTSFDGLVTVKGQVAGQSVGVIWCDFRVHGASFAKHNSQRISAFVQSLAREQVPLVFFSNSLGVRFYEERIIFDDVFRPIADIYQFKKNHLFLTCALGNTLGLAALLFAQGHYRVAVEDETPINLTGPEVHRRFFANSDAPFDSFAGSDKQFAVNELIHELAPDSLSAIRRTRELLVFLALQQPITLGGARVDTDGGDQGGLILAHDSETRLRLLKTQLGDAILELFQQRSPIARCYLAQVRGQLVGYLVNPPQVANNMLSARAVDQCTAALELYRVLKLPVITLLDCPGGDPRKKESDQNILLKMIDLVQKMIEYPFPKMGIIQGRAFGGSGMFAFPKIYGGQESYVINGSQMGVMHKSIIQELLSGSKRLLEVWKQNQNQEKEDYSDLVDAGIIKGVIEKNQIRTTIDSFVAKNHPVNSGVSYPRVGLEHLLK